MNLFDHYLTLAFATLATFGTSFLTYGEKLPECVLLLLVTNFVTFLLLLHRSIAETTGITIRSNYFLIVIVVVIIVIVDRGRSGSLPRYHLGN